MFLVCHVDVVICIVACICHSLTFPVNHYQPESVDLEGETLRIFFDVVPTLFHTVPVHAHDA